MILGHPSETELQRYALKEPGCTTEVIGHIEQCESCRTSISAYRLVSTGIKQQTRPAFEFDVAELILTQLEQVTPAPARSDIFFYVLIFGGLALIGLPFYLFRQDLVKMLSVMLPATNGLLITTAALILLFYGIEMIRKYRKQVKALNY